MALRGVLLGFLAGIAVCSVTYLNDAIMQQTYFVGNHLPVGVFGAFLLWMAVVNPLLHRARHRWALPSRDIAVALAIALCCCAIPGSGLLRFFTNTLVLPIHYSSLKPEWRANEVLSYLPPEMLVAGGEDDERAVGGFVLGLGDTRRHIGLGEIPWDAWATPLATWLPIVVLLFFGTIGLSFVVVRQWAEREHLAFPVAEVAGILMERDPDRPFPTVFYNRLFWIGVGMMVGLHLLNMSHQWFDKVPPFPTYLNMWPLMDIMGPLKKGFGWVQFYLGMVIPTVVAFAYFVPTDVSFTLGIGCLATMTISVFMASTGLDQTYDFADIAFGAYAATLCMILYTGRAHYWSTLKCALGLHRGADPEPTATWGARVWFASGVLLVLALSRLGVDWTVALLFVLIASMLLLVMSRIIAETGLFFIQCPWNSLNALTHLLGATALGPKLVTILGTISAPLLVDLRETLMPFAVNALRLGRRMRAPMRTLGLAIPFAMVAALAVGLVVTLWFQYDLGHNRSDMFGAEIIPQIPFNDTLNLLGDIRALPDGEAALARSLQLGPLERIFNAQPRRGTLPAIAAGMMLVLSFSFLRLRFRWWPIHPVLFLVAYTYPIMCFWACFFFGWMIKSATITFGGGKAYHRLKPLMVGIIAGELSMLFLYFLFGLAYYLGLFDPLFVWFGYEPVAGINPKPYRVFPG